MKIQMWSRALTAARFGAIAAALMVMAPALAEAAIAVTLNWSASSNSSTAGYYVYAGVESHNYTTTINVGNTTSLVIYLPDARDPATTYYFAVQAYSATGALGQLSAETVFPVSQAPTLRNPGNMSGIVGVTITAVQLTATDPGSSALTYSAGGLPPGLAVSTNGGRITGTPTTAGDFYVTVAATNAAGVSATQLFTWSIFGPTSGGTPGTIGTPPPTGGTPGTIGTPPPSGGTPGTIGTPPPSSGNPGGGITPPASGSNPGGGNNPAPPANGGIPPAPPFNGGNPGGVAPGNPGAPASGSEPGNNTNPVPPGPDVTAPTLQIVSPDTGKPYRTMNTRIIVTGTASDNVGVVTVMWANNRGGVGTALGTSAWATTPIDLKMGDNILTITASDAAGNVRTITLMVTRIVDFENYLN